MLTEEKTAEPTPQPELFAAAGRYYIMDRRTKSQSEPQEQENSEPQPHEAPISAARTRSARRSPETGALGHLMLGLAGASAGAVIAVLYPLESAEFATGTGFLSALSDRLMQCAAFLVVEYILGYFAAGAVLVWAVPAIYGLGAGLTAAASVMSGSPVMILPFAVYTIVISLAAARSAEFSSLLLSIVSGKSGSVLTDGTAGSAYTIKFGIYLMTIAAAAILEAGIGAI